MQKILKKRGALNNYTQFIHDTEWGIEQNTHLEMEMNWLFNLYFVNVSGVKRGIVP